MSNPLQTCNQNLSLISEIGGCSTFLGCTTRRFI